MFKEKMPDKKLLPSLFGYLRVGLFMLFLNLLAVAVFGQSSAITQPQDDSAQIRVDFKQEKGALEPIWAYWGYDEPNYTYMKNGKKLLTEISELSPVPVYLRTHNLMTTGDGTARLKWGSTNMYTEDAQGNPVYDWTIIDKIFDTYVNRGMKPLVEIGFMPKALSSHPEPYAHHWSPDKPYADIFTGWAYPPKDYEKWADMVYHWVQHNIERYGRDEVRTWKWEVWNEPNIDYWKGSKQEYFKLYDYGVDAVKRALPEATVGGPHSTDPRFDGPAQFLHDFLDHCKNGKNYATGITGAPLDYIGFHAKGSPKVVNEHVQMGINAQLQDIEKGFQIVASYPEFKHLPIIIGESDPEGCAACSTELHPQNGYRNGTMYSSYTAASFARIYELADKYGVNIEGALSWSFEFENEPWFAGFRSMATNGVDKPVLNVFRMFGMMQGNRVKVQSDHAIPLEDIVKSGVRGDHSDVDALASRSDHSASVLIWNYYDDNVDGPPSAVHLSLNGLPEGKILVRQYRVDQNHSNSYTVWKEMGSPQDVTPEQYKQLERAGQLHMLHSPKWITVSGKKTDLSMTLPRRAVSLVQLTW